MGAKSNQKFIDSPEFDEFFRRGDEPVHGFDTLQPVADLAHEDEAELQSVLRTPAQVERRAKFIKLVSVTMAFLTVGSATAFTFKAVHGHRPASTLAIELDTHHQAQNQPPNKVAPTIGLAAPRLVVPAVGVVAPPEAPAIDAVGTMQSAPVAVAVNEPVKTAAALLEGAGAAAKSPPVAEKGEPKPTAAQPATAASPAQVAKPVAAVAASIVPPTPGASKPVAQRPLTPQAARAKAPAAKTPAAKATMAKVTSAKPVGPKPADYHPPTASFSD